MTLQAMNFFAGLLLLLMPEENAFWYVHTLWLYLFVTLSQCCYSWIASWNNSYIIAWRSKILQDFDGYLRWLLWWLLFRGNDRVSGRPACFWWVSAWEISKTRFISYSFYCFLWYIFFILHIMLHIIFYLLLVQLIIWITWECKWHGLLDLGSYLFLSTCFHGKVVRFYYIINAALSDFFFFFF